MDTLDGVMYLAESAVLENNSHEIPHEEEVSLNEKVQCIAQKIIGAVNLHLETGTIALPSEDAD